jgi:hypothetical protein
VDEHDGEVVPARTGVWLINLHIELNAVVGYENMVRASELP